MQVEMQSASSSASGVLTHAITTLACWHAGFSLGAAYLTHATGTAVWQALANYKTNQNVCDVGHK